MQACADQRRRHCRGPAGRFDRHQWISASGIPISIGGSAAARSPARGHFAVAVAQPTELIFNSGIGGFSDLSKSIRDLNQHTASNKEAVAPWQFHDYRWYNCNWMATFGVQPHVAPKSHFRHTDWCSRDLSPTKLPRWEENRPYSLGATHRSIEAIREGTNKLWKNNLILWRSSDSK